MMATRVLVDSSTADMEPDAEVSIAQLMDIIRMPMNTR